ncbi:hypothetical protein CFE70_002762 [Pyrenophora teres f. teres 0-1]
MAPNTDFCTRTLIVTLKSPPISKTTRAIAASFEPNVLPLKILPHHVQDAPRSSRPTKQTEEVKEQIFQQGSFSYDKKGPYHIYQPETKAEREDAAQKIEQLNAELKPIQREE